MNIKLMITFPCNNAERTMYWFLHGRRHNFNWNRNLPLSLVNDTYGSYHNKYWNKE